MPHEEDQMSEKTIDAKEYRRLVEQETLIFAVTEATSELLEREGTSRSQLARALGRTKGFVSQLLSGKRNMTLRTVADLAFALNHRFELNPVPLVDEDDGSTDRTEPPSARPRQTAISGRDHIGRITTGIGTERWGRGPRPRGSTADRRHRRLIPAFPASGGEGGPRQENAGSGKAEARAKALVG
jgi:transcriptional regulator with XRE-family HTH domain